MTVLKAEECVELTKDNNETRFRFKFSILKEGKRFSRVLLNN